MEFIGLSGERRCTAVKLGKRHIQPNEWVALLYFESQKAMQKRSDQRPKGGLDLSGVAAIGTHVEVGTGAED
jgi:hypothetical protein